MAEVCGHELVLPTEDLEPLTFLCDRRAGHLVRRHAEEWVASWEPDGSDPRWNTQDALVALHTGARPRYDEPIGGPGDG